MDRIALRAELGAGSMLSSAQVAAGFTGLVQGHFRFAFSLIDALAVQASVGSWNWPAGRGQLYGFTLGARFEPRVGTLGRVFVDLNMGAGATVDRTRFALDVGVGFEFTLMRRLGLGPVLRYGHVFAAGSDVPSDAQFLSVGASFTYRFGDRDRAEGTEPEDTAGAQRAGRRRPGTPRPGDADGDGVPDREDRCRGESAGRNPDPRRLGCPQPDRDDDGVADSEDQCPGERAGRAADPNRPGCPAADQDHDGVADAQDQCPDRRAGLHPETSRPGCPMPDRDRDNVPDERDACPDQAGSPRSEAARNGCPGNVALDEGQLRILQPVSFGPGSDQILPESEPVLEGIADALRANRQIRRVAVGGHTDEAGDAAANLDLSRRRAAAVVQWLTQHGVDAARLEPHGYGETRPVIRGTTPEASAANRRVEFRIVSVAQ